MAQCQPLVSAMQTLQPRAAGRTLNVTFDLDMHDEQQNSNSFHHHNGGGIRSPILTGRRSSDQQNFDRLLCNEVNASYYRRHSSEIKNVLPKVSISRANSDLLLNVIHRNSNGGHVTGNVMDAKKNFEKKRTNMALKKLASYINLKPQLKFHEHNYQRITWMLTNIKPARCRICLESIYFQCYECLQCKLMGHKKCLQNLFVKCPNKMMPPRLTAFGLGICDGDNQISEVLAACIMEIEKRPVHSLRGIYRKEGNPSTIERLCLSFEFGAHLIDLSQITPYDIAGVVKEYLSRLSTPIFNETLQSELITIGREWPVRKVPYTKSGMAILVFELRRLIGTLSPGYRNNLAYLIYHLKRIVDRQHITEMTPNSLAIIFANLIFLNDSGQHEHRLEPSSSIGELTCSRGVHIVMDATIKIRVIELMICHANDIFSDLR